jgi:hypothetical protein
MPTQVELYIKLNGGAPQSGVVTAAFADSCVLSPGNTATGGKKAQFRIVAFPPGFPCPSGWTTEGKFYTRTVTPAGDCPAFSLPAALSAQWGKFRFDIIVDEQRANGQSGVSQLYARARLKIPSTSGVETVAYLEEDGEFDAITGYVAALDSLARRYEEGMPGTGDVSGPGSSTSGNIAAYNGVSGLSLQDSGVPAASVVLGPASAVVGGLATYSNVNGKVVADAGIGLTEIAQAFNVRKYGASPAASAAANFTAFQNAATAAAAAGVSDIFVPAGTYAWPNASSLVLVSNQTLRGEGERSVLSCAATSTTIIITAAGTQAAGTALAGNATAGALSLNVSSVGFADGDWVKVYSTAVTGATNLPKGEICRIKTAATMTLYDPLRDSYATADAATVAKITFVENVTIKDIKIIGPVDNTVVTSGILLDRVRGAKIERVATERCHFYGIALQDSINVTVDAPHCTNSETGGLAYGVAIFNACQDCTVTAPKGWRLRHLVTTGGFSTRHGVPRRIATVNGVASQCRNSGFDAHAGGEEITYSNCHVHGSESDGFSFEAASGGIKGGSANDCAGHGVHLNPQSVKPFKVSVEGVSIGGKSSTTVRNGVRLTVNAGYETFDSVIINGNPISDCRYGVNVVNTQTGRVTGLVIQGNSFKRCARNGEAVISVQHAQGVVIGPNDIYEDLASSDGISLTDVVGGTVNGNEIALPNSGGCRGIRLLTTCSELVIDGNRCTGGASSIGIEISNTSTGIRVGSSNKLSGCATELSRGTGTGHSIGLLDGLDVLTTNDDYNFTSITFPRHRTLLVDCDHANWADVGDSVSLPATPCIGELVTVIADGNASVAGDNIPINASVTIQGNVLINTNGGSRTYRAVSATLWQLVGST